MDQYHYQQALRLESDVSATIVFFDDASFSGNQVMSELWYWLVEGFTLSISDERLKQFCDRSASRPLTIAVLPCITERARARFARPLEAPCRKVIVVYDKVIPSLATLLQQGASVEEPRSTALILSKLAEITSTRPPKLDMGPASLRQEKLRSLPARDIQNSAIYFDHRLPDGVSTYTDVYEGTIPKLTTDTGDTRATCPHRFQEEEHIPILSHCDAPTQHSLKSCIHPPYKPKTYWLTVSD